MMGFSQYRMITIEPRNDGGSKCYHDGMHATGVGMIWRFKYRHRFNNEPSCRFVKYARAPSFISISAAPSPAACYVAPPDLISACPDASGRWLRPPMARGDKAENRRVYRKKWVMTSRRRRRATARARSHGKMMTCRETAARMKR